MTGLPDTDTGAPGASPSHDGWNIERLWTTPLARLSGKTRHDRLPALSELRQSWQSSVLNRDRTSGRSSEARRRLLDELARHDTNLS